MVGLFRRILAQRSHTVGVVSETMRQRRGGERFRSRTFGQLSASCDLKRDVVSSYSCQLKLS